MKPIEPPKCLTLGRFRLLEIEPGDIMAFRVSDDEAICAFPSMEDALLSLDFGVSEQELLHTLEVVSGQAPSRLDA